MSLSPQVCKKNYKVHIPSIGEECEFWLVRVTDEQSISNPDKDHAYYTDDGKLFIYDGKNLVRVNCDICFTQEEREKLEDIEEGANKYVLPVATDNALGGVKLGYSKNGKNYPVVKDSEGNIYVAVPWEEYSLPQAETNTLGGIKTGYEQKGQNYPVLIDVDGNAYVTVPWTNTDTKYNVVSTTENGLAPMLPTENADKKFLNGEGEWAEVKESINGNTVTGSTFSGETSDCGVELKKIVGKTVQNGTPSPDSPVEIENVEISNITSHGRQLFDSSKIATKSQGGATVTNNGDGSFTVSGSGNLTENFSQAYWYSKEDTLSLLKQGTLKVNGLGNISPNIIFGLRNKTTKSFVSGKFISKNLSSCQITQSDLDTLGDDIVLSMDMYTVQGTQIVSGTIKPMIYADGDGTWDPYEFSTTNTDLTLAEGDIYENGTITRKKKQVVFDGSSDENFSIEAIGTTNRITTTMLESPPSISTPNGICNRFKFEGNYVKDTEHFYVQRDQIFMFINASRANSVEEFRTWLKSNPLEIEYELATPTTEALEIPTIPSYFPYTCVSTDSEVDPEITFRPLPYTTCLVGEATEEESGYMPKLSGNASQFLNGQGGWSTPSGYTLPQASTTTLGGVKIGSNITVSSGTISLTKANVVSALGYTPPTTNTTYGVATTSTNGLMSATDKSRLDQLWAKFDSMVFFTND